MSRPDHGSIEETAREEQSKARLVDDGAAMEREDLPRGARNAPDGEDLTPADDGRD